jgi:DNA-binding Lrp family transcriptional regulator
VRFATFQSWNFIRPTGLVDPVDEVDFRLLMALYRDPLQSVRKLARDIGMSAPAVAARLSHLERQGILNGFAALPNAHLFGRTELVLRFAGPRTREDALRLLALDDVAIVSHKVDGGLTVIVWPDGNRSVVDRVLAALGAAPFDQLEAETPDLREPSPLDWRVLRACVERPRHTTKELVTLTGLSAKTAVRHRDALLAARALSIQPLPGNLGSPGEVVYLLVVRGSAPETILRKCLGDCVVIQFTEPPASYVLCHATDVSDMVARMSRLRHVEGVSDVEVSLNREVFVNEGMFLSQIDERLRFWGRTKQRPN